MIMPGAKVCWPLAALLAAGLGVPLWLQLHGYEAWDDIKRAERWSAERATNSPSETDNDMSINAGTCVPSRSSQYRLET